MRCENWRVGWIGFELKSEADACEATYYFFPLNSSERKFPLCSSTAAVGCWLWSTQATFSRMFVLKDARLESDSCMVKEGRMDFGSARLLRLLTTAFYGLLRNNLKNVFPFSGCFSYSNSSLAFFLCHEQLFFSRSANVFHVSIANNLLVRNENWFLWVNSRMPGPIV